MEKEEVLQVLSSEFWKMFKDKLAEEKSTATWDLLNMDFTASESNLRAIKIQAKLEAIEWIEGLAEDILEEVKEA